MTKRILSIAITLFLSACGGSSAGSTSEPATSEAQGGEQAEQGGAHPSMPPELVALHDVLAPVWHAEPGATRAELACAEASRLDEESRAVAAAAPPEGVDPSAWSAAAERLSAGSAALVSECGAAGTEVETRLSELHDAFHALLDMRR